MAVKRRVGYASDAEVVRSAIYVAAVEDAQGRPLVSMDEALRAFRWAAEEVERARRAFRAQLGRLREVAVRLPASAPIARLKKRLKEQLRRSSDVPIGLVVAYSLATYLHVLERRPTGLPEPVRGMLRLVYERAAAAPRSERRRAALNELKLRMGTAKELAKSLDLPVDKWWESIMEEVAAAGDPEAVLRRYVEGGEVPRMKASDGFAEAAALVLKQSGDAEGLRRLWWLKRGLLLRAAENKAEREVVRAVDIYVERDPEAAFKLLKAVERGERPPPPPPPFDRAGFYAAVRSKLDTFDRVAKRVLARAREVGLPNALYDAGEYFRGFSRSAERDLKVMLDKAPPETREEEEPRQRLEAALDAATAVAAAGAAAGLMQREVEALTELSVQKFLAYCRRYLGFPEPTWAFLQNATSGNIITRRIAAPYCRCNINLSPCVTAVSHKIVLIKTGGVDEAAMMVLRKVSNYISILDRLKKLGIDFRAWEYVEELKNGILESFLKAGPRNEDLRRQSFERRREQAWQSFLRLVAGNVKRLSDSDVYVLAEKMMLLIKYLNETEETLFQLIHVSPEFTLEKIRQDSCVKKCDIEYGNSTKVTEYFTTFGSLVSAVVAYFFQLGVPWFIILLISLAVGMPVVSFLRDRKRRKLYEACINKCDEQNRVVRLSEKVDDLISKLNYVVDEISNLLGVNSSSVSTERVVYSGYLT